MLRMVVIVVTTKMVIMMIITTSTNNNNGDDDDGNLGPSFCRAFHPGQLTVGTDVDVEFD